MYNSIFINILMSITNLIKEFYRNSILRRIVDSISRFFYKSKENSTFLKFFDSLEGIFVNSIFFKLFKGLLRIFDILLDALFNLRKKIFKNSFASDSLGFYSRSILLGLRLVYITMIMFGVLFAALSISGFIYMSFKIPILILIVGLIGLLINGREVDLLRGSNIFMFFYEIFQLDKEGETWW